MKLVYELLSYFPPLETPPNPTPYSYVDHSKLGINNTKNLQLIIPFKN